MRVRIMRGQVVVREDKSMSSIIEIVGDNPRERKSHRGIVMAMGNPAITKHGHEVAWGFDVGQMVQWHFEKHEGARTRIWPEDGKEAIWLMQQEIDGVIEE